jgi:hypothetical protein
LAVALSRFGAPQDILDGVLTAAEDEILWFGASPTRVDLLFSAPGIEFQGAYARRETVFWDGVQVDVIRAGRPDRGEARRRPRTRSAGRAGAHQDEALSAPGLQCGGACVFGIDTRSIFA